MKLTRKFMGVTYSKIKQLNKEMYLDYDYPISTDDFGTENVQWEDLSNSSS